jgi:hypothetical protein
MRLVMRGLEQHEHAVRSDRELASGQPVAKV